MKRKGRIGGGSIFATTLLVFFIILAGVVIFGKYFEREEEVQEPGKEEVQEPEKEAKVKQPVIVRPVPSPVRPSYRVAIVIDDMGMDMSSMRELLALPTPITVAVLPRLKHTRDVSMAAHEAGFEVLLHLPMEPIDVINHNPGEGALYTGMTDAEMREILAADMDEVPFAVGINNHMGSKFTEDESAMRTVFKVVGENDLFFLDSLTSEKTIVKKVAEEFGVKTASRNVFLDNSLDKDYIRGQFRKIIRIAKKKGAAIAIGHPHPETLDVLREVIAGLEKEGIKVVRVGELVN